MLLTGCPHSSPTPITPPYPDAQPDADCTVIDRVNAARLIRDPVTGHAKVFPCDAGD